METLEQIVENAKKYKDKDSASVIVKRFGCDTIQSKIRKDRIVESSSSYNAFYITNIPLNRNNIDLGGFFMYRNSPLATVLLQETVGGSYVCYTNRAPNQIYSTLNEGIILNEIDFIDHYVLIEGEEQRTFNTLEQFLAQLQKTREEREENLRRQRELEEERKRAEEEARSAQEKKRITEEIKKIKLANQRLEGQIEEQLSLTKYIHNQAQLKFRPIVDRVQSRIKFNDLYNGTTIIISGGPGTGKTTTMIARLKYLTDEHAINEDIESGQNRYNLSKEQSELLLELIKEDRDWIFFSPSQLLKEYLSKAMEGEKLSRPSSKTQNWKEFRNLMMREYGFFNLEDTSSPFKRCRNEKLLIFHNSHAIDKLCDDYINRLNSIVTNLSPVSQNYEWYGTAQYIKSKLSTLKELKIEQIVDLLILLKVNAYEECKNYEVRLKEYVDDFKERLYEIYGAIKQNVDDYSSLCQFIKSNKPDENIEEEFSSDDDADDNGIVDVDTNELTEDQKLYNILWSVVKPYSRSLVTEKRKLTERQLAIIEKLQKYLSNEDNITLLNIGEYYILKDYIKFVTEPSKVLLQGIPQLYKKFRKRIFDENDCGWNLDLLGTLISQGNKELHIQEQALILGFVNNLVRIIQKKNQHIEIKGKYADCYNKYSRPIIGIDEATDFSEIEIYAMLSFARTDFSSITIAGDIMQRMTDRGLKTWDDLKNVVPQYRVEQLNISYRQSKKMLNVALELYHDTMGEKANFKAHLKEDNVPEAIAIVHEDEDEKINWIEQRIREIYKIYGNHLPSIAIFLNDKNEASLFASKLQDTDFFYDNGISVVDCSQGQTIGNTGQVRVFPIDTVKGMEFDVVFFHNIDNAALDSDLVKRYLYVGVSRASFFLGATFKHNNEELSKYFKLGTTWKNNILKQS